MSWVQSNYPFESHGSGINAIGSFSMNEQCFVRKQHPCGKMHGVSKSCFIACPTDDDLEPILNLMSEKLKRLGIDPIIAVKDRAYGQDIFCTKICGKIIESRFCIVILDDLIKNEINIPNPNVYYEYGLMTSLRKHIIPLQKEDLNLAFNIQSHDTIKYNSRSISTEIEIAIRDAIKLTEEKENSDKILVNKSLLRKLELEGFEATGKEWILSDVIEDTAFKGFRHSEKGFYAYVGKIDNLIDIQTYIEDLGVVIYRTERKIKHLKEEINKLKEQRGSIAKQISGPFPASSMFIGGIETNSPLQKKFEAIESKIAGHEIVLKRASKIFLAFIVNPEIDLSKFPETSDSLVKEYSRYIITISQDRKIEFDDISINLYK